MQELHVIPFETLGPLYCQLQVLFQDFFAPYFPVEAGLMTALMFRPVDLRLQVAALCDASRSGFPKFKAGSAFLRFLTDSHPYRAMWEEIMDFYKSNDWETFSDQRLKADIGEMSANGFKSKRGQVVSSADIREAKARWIQNGWFDYEMQRDSKQKTAMQFSLYGGGAMTLLARMSGSSEV